MPGWFGGRAYEAKLNTKNRIHRFIRIMMGDESANYPASVAVSGEANAETISFIRKTDCHMVAEIGIYKGHTSIELARYLNGQGELHLFDFQDRVDEVCTKLKRAGFTNVVTHGCSHKLLDSYNWRLAKLLQQHDEPIFDYIFLDGAHTFAFDALAFFLGDRLLRIGGYFDFDDYGWTVQASPSLRLFPLTRKMYTPEQIAAPQVKMIIDLLVRRGGYKEVFPNKIFQKQR